MAATVSSSVWGVKSKAGAWALDSEQHEDDLLRDLQPPSSDFPSLSSAASTKTNKKKPHTLSLAEFSTYSAPKPDSQRLTTDELLSLPTGPRQRSSEELDRSRSGFGGGFRSYGHDSSSNPRSRVSDRAPEGLSRADEADDWSKSRKFTGVEADRRDKVGFFNSSRADEVDNWASNKSEGRRDRRMGFDSSSNGGADSDNWTKASNGPRERRGVGFESSGAADSDNWLKKDTNGGAVDSGRPRLNLSRRTVPINNNPGAGEEVKPKGANPFGEARPREEVLKEIDDKLEAMKAKEEGANGSELRRKEFGIGRNDSLKDDLMDKTSWRKGETETAQPASADNVENGDAEDSAAENTVNGDAQKN